MSYFGSELLKVPTFSRLSEFRPFSTFSAILPRSQWRQKTFASASSKKDFAPRQISISQSLGSKFRQVLGAPSSEGRLRVTSTCEHDRSKYMSKDNTLPIHELKTH